MKALIYKDLCLLRSYFRSLVLMFVFYLLIGVLNQNSSIFAALVGVLCIISSITSFSYDQFCGWDLYCASLPVGRRTMVLAKYGLVMLLTLSGMAIMTVSGLLLSLVGWGGDSADILPGTLGAGSACCLMVMVLLPFIYRYGVEKGRIILMILSVAIFSGFFAAAEFQVFSGFSEMSFRMFLYFYPLLLVLACVVSYQVSCRFFEAKDL